MKRINNMLGKWFLSWRFSMLETISVGFLLSSGVLASTPAFTNRVEGAGLGDRMLILANAWYAAQKSGAPFYFNSSGWGKAYELLGLNHTLRPLGRAVLHTNLTVIGSPWNRGSWLTENNSILVTPIKQHFHEGLIDAIRFNPLFHREFQALFERGISVEDEGLDSDQRPWTIGIHIRKNRTSGKELGLCSSQYYASAEPYRIRITCANDVELAMNATLHVDAGAIPKREVSVGQMLRGASRLDQVWPAKFLPEQYYLDQLLFLRKILQGSIRVLVFSDDDCHEICSRLVRELAERAREIAGDIELVPVSSPKTAEGMVQDLLLLSQCDCLIRSGSHFACAAQLLGKHKIVVRPAVIKWVNGCLTATCVWIYDYTNEQITRALYW